MIEKIIRWLKRLFIRKWRIRMALDELEANPETVTRENVLAALITAEIPSKDHAKTLEEDYPAIFAKLTEPAA